ncbi:PREDICTED: oocyte-expressed protein homolog [Elephantulus edwardii]|uniref:oocyte-expressed protein homolog n=1 Tax=Elephantulus edwardii TaxID=28737 RepID=UPI0003F0CA6E|nr:PREDICTED: oocyte-expressed protein homolog [Elephantulus edwardii]
MEVSNVESDLEESTAEDDVEMEVDQPPGIPPRRKLRPRGWWLKPQHLQSRLVVHVEAPLLEAIFGPRMAFLELFERVNEVLLDVRVTDPAADAEITIFGRRKYQERAEWLLQAMADRRRDRRFRGMEVPALEEAMSLLEVYENEEGQNSNDCNEN